MQKFLRDQIRLNHNETIIPSSLDAMRDQYEDLLADFRCEGREIFHVVFNRTDSHPSQSKQTDAAMFSYIYISECYFCRYVVTFLLSPQS